MRFQKPAHIVRCACGTIANINLIHFCLGLLSLAISNAHEDMF